MNYLGGALLDLGVEHIGQSGFLVGAELSQVSLLYPLLGLSGRVRIGYGGPAFALSLGLGSGYPFYMPSVGFNLRAGRLDRTYVEFSLYWVTPIPYPLEGLIHISAPTSDRWRFTFDLGGNYYVYGPYLLLGGERKLGSGTAGLRGTSAVSLGLGLIFPIATFGIPGPMLSVGYEKRF
jgi:hypothetical protein